MQRVGAGSIGAPGRRAVLALLAAAGGSGLAGLLAGCDNTLHGATGGLTTPPTPDDLAVARTASTALQLRSGALAAARGGRSDDVLRRIAEDHAAHAAALGVTVPGLTGATGSNPTAAGPPITLGPAPSQGPTGGPASSPTPATPATQFAAEWAGARAATRDLLAAADPGLAALLARIAASRAVHTDLLAAITGLHKQPATIPPAAPLPAAAGATRSADGSGSRSVGTPTPTATPTATRTDATGTDQPLLTSTARDALNSLLAGEDAAVYGYPVVAARCAPRRRALAIALWQQHIQLRDELTLRLNGGGAQPIPAAPGYDVGRLPTTPQAAARLAARIENGLAAVAVSAISQTTGELRGYCAQLLVSAARRAATWDSPGAPLPGGPLPSPQSSGPRAGASGSQTGNPTAGSG